MNQQSDSGAKMPKNERELFDEVCYTEGNLLNQTNALQQHNPRYVQPFEINQDKKSSPTKIHFQNNKGEELKANNEDNLINFFKYNFQGTQSSKFQDDFNLKNENSENINTTDMAPKNVNILQQPKELEFVQIINRENTPTQQILQLNLQSNPISINGYDTILKKNNEFHNILSNDSRQEAPQLNKKFKGLFSNLIQNNKFNTQQETGNSLQPQPIETDEENGMKTDIQQENNKLSGEKKKGLFQKKRNKILWMFKIAKTFDKQSSSLFLNKKNYLDLLRRKIRILIYLLRFYEIIKEINKQVVQRKTQSDVKRKMTSHIYRRYTWFPLFPNDPFKNFWNVSLFISLILMSFITPFTVCIVDNYDEKSVWFGLDTLFDIIFGFDIIINFLSAYQDDKSKIVQNYQEIIKNYVTGWFFVDIIAILPFNRLSNGSATYNKLVRLLRLPRLYNLAKLIKLNRAGSDNLITKIQDRLKMNIASRQLLNLFFMTLIASHLIACLWFLTSRMDDFSARTWVYRKGILNSNYGEKYITSIYWAFQTLFVIGYGDLGAFTISEQVVSIIWMFFSVGFYSFVISNLSSLIIQANKKQTMLKDTLDGIDQIQAKCKLPPTLVKKIKKFYETNYDNNIYFPFLENNQSVILDDMWDNIKQEVILLSQIDYLNKVDIFKVNFIFTSHILPYLKMQKFKEDEIIYRKDDSSEEIFFLISGEVCLLDSNNNIILKIRGGSMFGEVEVIEMQNRRDFCRCLSDCMVLMIDKDRFLREMEKFENLKDEIIEICKMKNKLMEEARNKIQIKRLQTRVQKEFNSNKDKEKRDSIFEEQSGIEFYMQKKRLPNSSRHYFLFLKAYNKYREKMTKKKLNIVYSEMFEEDVEDKSDGSEGNDEIFEADQEEFYEEQEEVDSNAYRKMYTSKVQKALKRNATNNGKSFDNIYDNFHKNQFQSISCRTIPIPNDGTNNNYNQKKEDTTPKSLLNGTSYNLKTIVPNSKNETNGFTNSNKFSLAKLKGNESNSENSQCSENLDDFNQVFDQYQIQETNNNILQAKIKKIKNNVQMIQRLKQQYDLLIREVNLKKNVLSKFTERQELIKNQQENK